MARMLLLVALLTIPASPAFADVKDSLRAASGNQYEPFATPLEFDGPGAIFGVQNHVEYLVSPRGECMPDTTVIEGEVVPADDKRYVEVDLPEIALLMPGFGAKSVEVREALARLGVTTVHVALGPSQTHVIPEPVMRRSLARALSRAPAGGRCRRALSGTVGEPHYILSETVQVSRVRYHFSADKVHNMRLPAILAALQISVGGDFHEVDDFTLETTKPMVIGYKRAAVVSRLNGGHGPYHIRFAAPDDPR